MTLYTLYILYLYIHCTCIILRVCCLFWLDYQHKHFHCHTLYTLNTYIYIHVYMSHVPLCMYCTCPLLCLVTDVLLQLIFLIQIKGWLIGLSTFTKRRSDTIVYIQYTHTHTHTHTNTHTHTHTHTHKHTHTHTHTNTHTHTHTQTHTHTHKHTHTQDDIVEYHINHKKFPDEYRKQSLPRRYWSNIIVTIWIGFLGVPAFFAALYLAWTGAWLTLGLIVTAVLVGKMNYD